MSARDGGPVFPRQIVKDGDGLWTAADAYLDVGGATLRDYYAGEALKGLVSDAPTYAKELEKLGSSVSLDDFICKLAWRYADGMLKARGS